MEQNECTEGGGWAAYLGTYQSLPALGVLDPLLLSSWSPLATPVVESPGSRPLGLDWHLALLADCPFPSATSALLCVLARKRLFGLKKGLLANDAARVVPLMQILWS